MTLVIQRTRRKLFTDQQVARLLYLTNQDDDILAETIEQINAYRTRVVKEARKLFEDKPDELKCCIIEMLDAAMYMRGSLSIDFDGSIW